MFSVKETQLINKFFNQTLGRCGVIIQKIPHPLWNPKIIAMFTEARALTLSLSIKSISAHFPCIHFNAIYHLALGLPINISFCHIPPKKVCFKLLRTAFAMCQINLNLLQLINLKTYTQG
jgi:hypothetical protein